MRNVTPNLRAAAVYVHWPFCAKICPYCNFNKYMRSNITLETMTKCLVQETDYLVKFEGIPKITSVFFGGGTPSLAPPSMNESLLNKLASHGMDINETEVSMEANPSSSTETTFKEFKLAGVNRLSLGVQALVDEDLKVLGRNHTVSDALNSVNAARKVFGDRVSIDLMFGRPNQTLDSWEAELSKVLNLKLNHVSLYHLTMEKSTPMEKMFRAGKLKLPSDDEAADMYAVAVQMLTEAGLSRYEVANFAKEGHESKHNQNYWFGGQYLGIGPGAHGRCWKQNGDQDRLLRQERIQILEPVAWAKEVSNRGHGTRKTKLLSELETLEEILILGLRTREGVSHAAWESYTARSILLKDFAHELRIQELVQRGFLILDDRSLRASGEGFIVLDSIIPEVCLSLEDILARK